MSVNRLTFSVKIIICDKYPQSELFCAVLDKLLKLLASPVQVINNLIERTFHYTKKLNLFVSWCLKMPFFCFLDLKQTAAGAVELKIQ